MLYLSRIDANSIALDRNVIDPKPFLKAFAADANVLAADTGHRFSANVFGKGHIFAEVSGIRRVLFNLLTNAIQASPAGSEIRLTASFHVQAWRATIEDDGPGVTLAQLEQIFDRFARLELPNGLKRGVGLGLPISRSIVRLHGGKIWAEPARSLGGLAVIVEFPRTTA